MSGKFIFFILVNFIFYSSASFGLDTYPFDNQQQSNRFYTLTHQTRCIVCQNQNLAESHAPIANDLKEKIYQMIKDDKTDLEITNFLVKRYGNFILLKPPVNKLTYLLWGFPCFFLVLAAYFLMRFYKSAS